LTQLGDLILRVSSYWEVCLKLTEMTIGYVLLDFFFKIIVVLSGGTWKYFQKLLQSIKYIVFEFTPSAALFHPLHPDSRKSQQVPFLHLLTCVYIIWITSPSPHQAEPVLPSCSPVL
jgi:hypothetical protein